jgi:hypothetical protein
MTRLIVATALALAFALPAAAQSPSPDKPREPAQSSAPVIERDALKTGAIANPTTATDGMSSAAMKRPANPFDQLNQPHRKYTQIQDYWEDR